MNRNSAGLKLTAVVLILVIAQFTLFAQSAADFDYTMAQDGSGWVIEKYKGNAARVTIPAKIEGRQVVAIGSQAFTSNSTLTSVVIPEGVIRIEGGRIFQIEQTLYGLGAFSQCMNLASVKLPGSLTEIGRVAFFNCSSLANITLPKNLSYIGEAAFSHSGLQKITIPGKVVKTQDAVFWACKDLRSVVIPGSLEEINSTMFFDCTALNSVKLGEGVKIIGENAFGGCTSLKTITIPKSIEAFMNMAFAGCSSLTTVKMPSSFSINLGSDIFRGCPLDSETARIFFQ